MSDESGCTMYASVAVYLCCAYAIQSAICGANGVLCAYAAYGIYAECIDVQLLHQWHALHGTVLIIIVSLHRDRVCQPERCVAL